MIDSSGWLISGCSHIGMEFLISTLYFFSCLYQILLFNELNNIYTFNFYTFNFVLQLKK